MKPKDLELSTLLKVSQVDNKEIRYLDIKQYKIKNVMFKRNYIEGVSIVQNPKIEEILEDLHSQNFTVEQIQETIFDCFWFNDIVCLIDFINPYPITWKIAKLLVESNVFLGNIKYSNKKDALYSKYVRDKNLYQNFDWYRALDNNFKFIITNG